MNIKYIPIIILFLFTLPLSAQDEVAVVKKEFKKGKNGFKDAWKALNLGYEAYLNGGEYYKDALDYLLTAQKYNDVNPELNYLIGKCYYGLNQFNEAYKTLRKAYEFKESVSADVVFLMARCLHRQSDFKKAIEEYTRYKSSLATKNSKNKGDDITKYIQECKNGIDIQQNANNIFIENLGEDINTAYPDYFPVLSKDWSKMYFASRRPLPKKDDFNKYDNLYYEDIYVAYNIDDEWKDVKNMEKPVNSNENDVLVGTSPDDSYLYLYKGKSNGGDIYETYNKDGKWKNPKSISAPINSKYKESSIFITSNNQKIYFISENEKLSLGGKDIFVINKLSEKKWSDPINLGSNINTPYDEESIFINADENTLYFSSKGHNSIGGFDIFKSNISSTGTFSKPENLGIPINTPADDLSFSILPGDRYAYYSSDGQKDNIGDHDIYKIIFMGPDKELISSNETDALSVFYYPLKTKLKIENNDSITNVTILKGVIKDADSLNTLYANIEIIDNVKNEVIYTSNSDSINGSYFVTLPAGNSYGISVTKEGYLFYSEYFDIPLSAKYQEIEKEILLEPVAIGTKLVLKNIFFEVNSATLQEESYVELGFVLKVLRENRKMRIEISGHTDNVGSHNFNMKLSEDRAKSVIHWLVGSGIDPGRLEPKGYGFTQPVASNDTEEGRQENRRVEFKIIGEKEEETSD